MFLSNSRPPRLKLTHISKMRFKSIEIQHLECQKSKMLVLQWLFSMMFKKTIKKRFTRSMSSQSGNRSRGCRITAKKTTSLTRKKKRAVAATFKVPRSPWQRCTKKRRGKAKKAIHKITWTMSKDKRTVRIVTQRTSPRTRKSSV